MEFLNGIFSRGFWAKTRVFSDSSFCLVFYRHHPFNKMLFMNRLEISCFADFLKDFLNQGRVWFSLKSVRQLKGLWIAWSTKRWGNKMTLTIFIFYMTLKYWSFSRLFCISTGVSFFLNPICSCAAWWRWRVRMPCWASACGLPAPAPGTCSFQPPPYSWRK
jgi:hypothetical protein